MAGPRRTEIQVLAADPGLGAHLDPAARQQASLELRAPKLVLEPGEWNPPRVAPEPAQIGFLLVEGLITRHLQVAGAHCAELLGRGDLLRPWQEDAASFVDARWLVLERATAAVITADLAARLCRYPPLIAVLIERAMQRSRMLAVFSAIDNVVGVERRLLLLFWHLAERWGKVERGGVIMPLRLTHQMLADLVGSRRPSVTTALRRLADAGAIAENAGGGWRLMGAPPEPGGGR